MRMMRMTRTGNPSTTPMRSTVFVGNRMATGIIMLLIQATFPLNDPKEIYCICRKPHGNRYHNDFTVIAQAIFFF
jgi:hypothetical protein